MRKRCLCGKYVSFACGGHVLGSMANWFSLRTSFRLKTKGILGEMITEEGAEGGQPISRKTDGAKDTTWQEA